MGRKRLIRQGLYPYHIGARTNRQEWFSVPLHVVWRIFISELAVCQERYEVKYFSFVLMSNHFHLLVQTPNLNVDSFMRDLLTMVSKKINHASGTKNHVFGGPYKWTIVEDDRYTLRVTKYVYRNPCRAKVSATCESYPYSSLAMQLTKTIVPIQFEIHPSLEFKWKQGSSAVLKWLNRAPSQATDEKIKLALRRHTFKIPAKAQRERTNLLTDT